MADRTAVRMNADGSEQTISFDELKKGDKFRLFEPDGAPADNGEWCVADSDPCQNEGRPITSADLVWHIEPFGLVRGADAQVVDLGLWERWCCPLSDIASMEKEFGDGVDLIRLRLSRPKHLRRFQKMYRRIKNDAVTKRYRYARRTLEK